MIHTVNRTKPVLDSPSASVRDLFVLGMIARRPIYGHEIMRILKVSHAEMWVEISEKHVYHVLRTLEQRGFVEGSEERVAGRPTRRRFTITRAGVEALQVMFEYEGHQRAIACSAFDTVVAMLAWGSVDDARALRILGQRRAILAERLEREHPPGSDQAIEASFGRVPRALYRKGQLLLEAELRWLDGLIAEAARLGWQAMRIHDVGEVEEKKAQPPQPTRARKRQRAVRKRVP